MKAYKATENMKCESFTYEIGKIYEISDMKMDSYGFHFCQDPNDVMIYYNFTHDFVLLEIEALGEIETQRWQSVTDKIKILRIVPESEYKSIGFGVERKRDRKGNIIYENILGDIWKYKYDKNNNLIEKKHPFGFVDKWKYNEDNILIWEKSFYGEDILHRRYDKKGNIVYENISGEISEYRYSENEKNNLIWQKDPDGSIQEWKYDENNNLIEYKSEDENWKIKTIEPDRKPSKKNSILDKKHKLRFDQNYNGANSIVGT